MNRHLIATLSSFFLLAACGDSQLDLGGADAPGTEATAPLTAPIRQVGVAEVAPLLAKARAGSSSFGGWITLTELYGVVETLVWNGEEGPFGSLPAVSTVVSADAEQLIRDAIALDGTRAAKRAVGSALVTFTTERRSFEARPTTHRGYGVWLYTRSISTMLDMTGATSGALDRSAALEFREYVLAKGIAGEDAISLGYLVRVFNSKESVEVLGDLATANGLAPFPTSRSMGEGLELTSPR